MRYGIDTCSIPVVVGRRKLVDGQEDFMVDVVLEMIAADEASGAETALVG